MGLNMGFEFRTASRIIFGNGSILKVPKLLAEFGNKILLATGKNPERVAAFLELLNKGKFETTIFNVVKEPTIEIVTQGVQLARETDCEIVVGIGGGSVIDAAKAIAALTPNPGHILDYLEVIGAGKSLQNKPLTCIAIPTSAGTGSEVTKNAVLLSPEHKVKVSLRSPLMFPDVAVIDPELTASMPPHVTASTGLDALSHLLETYVSNEQNFITDMAGRDGMRRISFSLLQAYKNGKNIAAREDMAKASFLGGVTLANAKLGAVHGFAGPIGGMFAAPHGVICGTLLPFVMVQNIKLLKEQGLKNSIKRYTNVAQILTGKQEATAEEGAAWVHELNLQLNLPKIKNIGITAEDFPDIIKKAKQASSMKGNPVALTNKDLEDILRSAFE